MSPLISIRLLRTQSDTRLVELARAGHERAFEALVERYRRALLGYARRQLLGPERAEDALQQGLLQAWLALREGVEVRHVRPWLYRIVHNAALNMRRCGYDYVQLSETLSGAGAPEEDLDRRIAVREALAGLAALPEMQREALLRTAVDGSSYEEAAVVLGCSEGAVRGLVHRARLTLRTAVSAVTPPPLLSWMLGSGGTADAPLASRIAEMGASGGSAGLTAGLLKLAATAATAGVMVGGIGILRHHPHAAQERHPPRAVAIVPASEGDIPAQAGAVQAFTREDVRYRERVAGGPGERARNRSKRSVGSSSRGPRGASHRHHITLVPTAVASQPIHGVVLLQPVAPAARGETIAARPGVEPGVSPTVGRGGYPAAHGAHSGGAGSGGAYNGGGGAYGGGGTGGVNENANEPRQGRPGADGTAVAVAGSESSSSPGSSGDRPATEEPRNTSTRGAGAEGSANGEGTRSERQHDASPSDREGQESRSSGSGAGSHSEGSGEGTSTSAESSTGNAAAGSRAQSVHP
jgi:RNA polymerase sigma factor (sigma-70 family)